MSKRYITAKARNAFKAKVKKLGGKHCYVDFDRYGNPRVYFWRKVDGKTGPKIRIRVSPEDEAAFRRAVADAQQGKTSDAVEPQAAQSPKTKQDRHTPAVPKSWRSVCEKFFAAPPSDKITSVDYIHNRRKILEALCEQPLDSKKPFGPKIGDMPYERLDDTVLRELEKRMVQRITRNVIVDKVTGRTEKRIELKGHEAYNRMVIHAGAVMDWARKEKLPGARVNWAKEIEKVRSSNTDGYHTMTVEEIERYRDHHRKENNLMALAAIDLLLYGGPRAGDAFALGPHHVKQVGGREMIVYVQQKGRAKKPVTAFIPLVPKLKESLDALNLPERAQAFILSERGTPFRSPKSFSNRFKKWCKEAGIDRGGSPHPMRKACVVRMIMDDHTPFEIMAVTGHKTMKEIERYGRQYLRERAAENVYDKWEAKHGFSMSEAETRITALTKLLESVKDRLDDVVLKQVEELLLAA